MSLPPLQLWGWAVASQQTVSQAQLFQSEIDLPKITSVGVNSIRERKREIYLLKKLAHAITEAENS